MKLKLSSIAAAASAAFVLSASVHAQPFSPSIGDGGGTIEQQVIGDTNASADHTQSTAIQQGNSANANGATITTGVDTRDQNTNNVSPTATGGAAIGNQSDNKSSASNGPQTMGQANTGTVGNTTATNGPISNQNVASGGAGGQGGAGGSASNVGINGQQQGIDRSGNSTNANTAAQGQGQTSANRNSQSTSAGNGAGAGAGSNNRTATAMTVDASDRSSTSYVAKSIALPPVLHGQAAPPLASAAMTVIPGVCGPRHYTETVPVLGTHHGILWDSSVPQGHDYTAVPATTPFIEKDGYLIGHMLNEFVAAVGTSSSKSISVWGVGKEQNGGGGGAANSGSHQQIVVRITVKDCLMPVKAAPVVEVKQVLVEAKPIRE